MDVHIKRNQLFYDCPKCSKQLRSPSSDAGKLDHCPMCRHLFTVPGEALLERAGPGDFEEFTPSPARGKSPSRFDAMGDVLEALLWRHWVLVAGLILWSPMYIPLPASFKSPESPSWQDLKTPQMRYTSQRLNSSPSVSDWTSVKRVFREVHEGSWYDVIYDSDFDRFLRVQGETSYEPEGTIDLVSFKNQTL